jgi:dTDP-4-amino-4,6-dideoxygalactose transaminase
MLKRIMFMIGFENLAISNEKFRPALLQLLGEILDSGQFVLGQFCEEFEKQWAQYCQSSHCVSLNSGTDALRMILEAYHFEPGSRIVLASNSYVATVLAVINAGLEPVFVDVDLNTYNIDPNNLELLDKTNISAIMPTHMYGRPCDMVAIKEWAGDLRIIADCCQAHGGVVDHNLADANAYSFYPTKNLGCLGDGGAVVTDDVGLANDLRKMRFYGVSSKSDSVSIGGGNSRLDEFQAAVLLTKLPYLDSMLYHKQSLAKIYCSRLNLSYIPGHAYYIFAVKVTNRQEFMDELLFHQIRTDVHYPVPAYRQLSIPGKFDNADLLADQIVSLPNSYSNTASDVESVCDIINGLRSYIIR